MTQTEEKSQIEEKTEQEPAQAVVIAGGTGFIGRRLAARLIQDRVPVVILSRRPAAAVEGVTFAQWAPGAPDSAAAGDGNWRQHLEGARAVVNLCGEIIAGKRWSDDRKRELTQSRVVPTQTLVDAINACDAPRSRLLQASGVGYYGIGEEPRDESAPAGTDFLAELAKAWEAPLAGLESDHAVLRFGVVLGRRGGALPQMLLPFRTFMGGPIGNGQQWLSWIHLDDAVSAIRHLIDAPTLNGPYNITAPEPVRNVTFAEAAGKALGRPAWVPMPKLLFKALLGEQATLVCDGQRSPPHALEREGFRFAYGTIDTALEDLTARR